MRENVTESLIDARFRKCDGCGSIVPVKETEPPSGFVDWDSIDGRDLDAAITEIGTTILALRACNANDEAVPSRLRARIQQMENRWFAVPTPEGATRRDALAEYENLRQAVEHVIADSPGTPETVKGYLREVLRGEKA